MDRDYIRRILGCVYNAYYEMGPGLLESVYEEALKMELESQGFHVDNQVQVPVYYKNVKLKTTLRLDLIIDRKVILELKSVKEYNKVFEKQLYTYLRLMNCELGYVINFNVNRFRDGIHTVYNEIDSKN